MRRALVCVCLVVPAFALTPTLARSSQGGTQQPPVFRAGIDLINVGATVSNINILSGGTSAFTRDVTTGGATFTEEIKRQLSVSHDEAEAWKLAWFFSGYPIEHLAAGGLFQPKKDFVESPAFKNFKDVPSMDVFLDDMKKSTYFAKSTVTADVGTALKNFFPKVWTDGQPAKQVLPDVQRELERIVAAAGK